MNKYLLLLLCIASTLGLHAQLPPTGSPSSFGNPNQRGLDNNRNPNQQGEQRQTPKKFDGMELPKIDDLQDSVMVDQWTFDKFSFQYTETKVDTGTYGIQLWEPRRLNGQFSHHTLGGIGHATNTRILSEEVRDMQFLPLKNYALSIMNSDKVRYFRSDYPFTTIYYYGPFFTNNPLSKTLRVQHSQNIMKVWSAGFLAEYFNYQTQYAKQETLNTQLSFFSSVRTKPYDNHTSFSYTIHDVEESGGLTSDSLTQNAKSSTPVLDSFKKNIESFNWAMDHQYRHAFITDTKQSFTYDSTLKKETNIRFDSIELANFNPQVAFDKNIQRWDTISISEIVDTSYILVKRDTNIIEQTLIDTLEVKPSPKFRYYNKYNKKLDTIEILKDGQRQYALVSILKKTLQNIVLDTLAESPNQNFSFAGGGGLNLDTLKHNTYNYRKIVRLPLDTIQSENLVITVDTITTEEKVYLTISHNFEYTHSYQLSKNEGFGKENNLKGLNIPYYQIVPDNLRDSTSYAIIHNNIRVGFTGLLPGLNFSAGFQHQFERYGLLQYHLDSQNDTTVDFINGGEKLITPKVKSDSTFTKSHSYHSISFNTGMDYESEYAFARAQFWHQFGGFQAGKTKLNLNIELRQPSLQSALGASLRAHLRPLSYFERHAPTAVMNWDTLNFDDESRRSLALYYRYHKKQGDDYYKLTPQVRLLQYDNYYYFDTKGAPSQTNYNSFEASLESDLQLGELNFYSKFIFQQTDNEEIAVPKLNLFSSLSYQFRFATLRIRPGIDFRMHSKFFVPDYSPITGQFINQREVQYGNYPLIDLFINFKLAQVRFFLKYQNAFTLFQQYPETAILAPQYYNTTGYPTDFFPHEYESYRLKVGILWKLFN